MNLKLNAMLTGTRQFSSFSSWFFYIRRGEISLRNSKRNLNFTPDKEMLDDVTEEERVKLKLIQLREQSYCRKNTVVCKTMWQKLKEKIFND